MTGLTFRLAEINEMAPDGPLPMGERRSATLVVLAGEGAQLAPATRALLEPALEHIARAVEAMKFKGATGTSLEIVAPQNLDWGRLILVGGAVAKPEDPAPSALNLGGAAMGKIGKSKQAAVIFDPPAGVLRAPPGGGGAMNDFMDFALGMMLRAYKFDAYKTVKKDKDDESGAQGELVIALSGAQAAQAAFDRARDLAQSVDFARNLVNEPPNALFPEEFARRVDAELTPLGVSVDALDQQALVDLKMNALLGVAQGSTRAPRVVVMRWNGGNPGDAPLAFVGKGVCFDSGGISIKPAAGMEDMKGDMAGAACVAGVMRALALRKAKVNVVGAIGLVENMPDGGAQRPGDIVRSMSGQTIEIINTDAEGRLVLADVLWHVRQTFSPKIMIDLATLTGAILVSLGQEYAGLFANHDELASRIEQAGKSSDEKVWRMPMGTVYDKMIDSKFADMKNTGGRYGGSITAAQFLKRYVGDVPWAHLDIAGVAMGSPANDINQSWASGWGVRLLDRLSRDFYEA